MSETRVSPSSTALGIFISAASSEFRSDRKEIADMLQGYGVVRVQEEYPTSLYSGNKIAEAIDQSDLIVCLIGYHLGYPFPPNDRPPDAREGCSWTQWEYDHAREVVRQNPEKRLAVFMNNATPAEPVDQRQADFRKRIFAAEESTPHGLFFCDYVGKEALAFNVKRMIDNPVGEFAALQYSFWRGIRDAYRRTTIDKWREAIPNAYTAQSDAETKARLMQALHPPFIETRGFSILNPVNGRQVEFLKPGAFLTGRDTNAELHARGNAVWKRLTRDGQSASTQRRSDGNLMIDALRQPFDVPVTLGSVPIQKPTRLFLVSGSGIGKSTTLAWIEARLNGMESEEGDPVPECQRLAILLLAGDLDNVKADQLTEFVVNHLIRKTILTAEPWQARAIRVGLKKDLDDGSMVLIIDGLDHISNDLPFLIESQGSSSLLEGWARCPIVTAGRPQALHAWRDLPNPAASAVASHWRFIEPDEFTDDEANVYLGNFGTVSRLSVVEEHLAGLLHVPRILEYVRTLNPDQLKQARTAADIYFAAVQQIVHAAMKSPVARIFGPDWEKYAQRDEPHEDQVKRMVALLSALAFMSLCRTIDPAAALPSHDFRMPLTDDRKEQLRKRLNHALSDKMNRRDLERDLRAVAAMSSVIGNGVLEDLSAQGTASLDSVMWANRTVQQFFAALWLSRYADGAKAVQDVLKGRPLHASLEGKYDAQRVRHYVFFPEADMPELDQQAEGCPHFTRTDVTYEFNLFLAEMPRIAIEPKCWIAAASAWYDPGLFGPAGSHLRVWSTEMLYRSWPTMLRIAGRPLDDWWDTSYERLVTHPPGRNRDTISPHWRPSDDDPDPLANLVLDRFLSDFERNLRGNQTAAAIAREMIAAEQWITVPATSEFVMGTPSDAPQACPTGKVDAYWRTELLDSVQTQNSTPHEAAETGTWPEWFAPGGVGRKGREGDLEWLENLLRPLANEAAARSLEAPDRDSPIYQKAFADIEARFKTCDETPAENPQSVRSFEMHRSPVLHRWFGLFAPGHKHVVQAYLTSLPDLTTAEPSRRLDARPAHPPDDHPVTYTSWFDAWAFCQWAIWQEGGKRYGLRLPHEPEWEFAARWTREAGLPVPSKRAWRWWWGDTFYSDENSLDAEIPMNARAHADGRPGKTRAPAEAEPNGLGFRDILGNVWEWTATLYNNERERDIWNREKFSLRYSRFDPKVRPPVNGQRTMRGGLWYYLSILATCANRFRYVCNDRDFKVGFRVVREVRPRR